jgi:hypothetical protein
MRSIWKDNSRLKIVYWSGFFLIMTLYFYFSKEEGYRNSEKRTAVVIDKLDGYIPGGRFRERHYLYPQFQFEYNDSMYTSADHIVSAEDMRVGDKLTVIFPANDPDDAVIYEFLSYWIDWITLIVCFLIAVFLFAVIWFITTPSELQVAPEDQ